MDRTERFYRFQQLLEQRRVVPRELALAELGVSLATFKRDLEYLRERLHAPIVWDREQGGYRFEAADPHGPRYGLPGLWFNASEIHAPDSGSPHSERWVAEEHWHPRQQGWFEADGHYRLDLPYSAAHELVMDILKYGPDVEVLAPADLRLRVADALAEAARQYR